MNFAYGGRSRNPVRKAYYNITITGLSIAVALLIGTIELVGLLADKLALRGSVANWLRNFSLNTAGFIILGMFVIIWAVAFGVRRLARIEENWSRGMERAAARAGADQP